MKSVVSEIVGAIINEFPELCWNDTEAARAAKAIESVVNRPRCAGCTCVLPSGWDASLCALCRKDWERNRKVARR